MKTLSYFNTSAQQVTTHLARVRRLEGALRDTTAQWIQVHDSAVVPAESAVPIKSWFITSGGSDAAPVPFLIEFTDGDLELNNGLYVCLSTTDGTKTLSSDKMDLSVDIARSENSVTKAGDRTTTASSLQVWSEAQGATQRRRLVAAYVTHTAVNEVHHLQLFAKDSPQEGDVPMYSMNIGNVNSRLFTFGKNGLEIFQNDSGTSRIGCTIGISSNGATFKAIDTGSEEIATIEAEYKNAI